MLNKYLQQNIFKNSNLNPVIRVLENLMVAQLVKNAQVFIKQECSLSCSQQLVTWHYSEPL
jgi:hypothetical protein